MRLSDDRAAALGRLYRARYSSFRNALTAVTESSEAARDMVQEAFARAHATRRELRADRGDESDWGDVLERVRGLGRGRAPRPRRRRMAMLVVGLGIAVLATGAALARPGDSVWRKSSVAASVRPAATGTLGLFRANAPEHLKGDRGDPVWHETVIAASLVRAATLHIPRAGEFAFWYATTRQYGRCVALGLPSGGWAGGPGGENVGGSLPGCYPTRTQINAAQVEHGGGPVYEITGFDYNESDLTVHGSPWRIYFGVIDGRGPAVRVVDTTAGRSARVTDGHLFAIAVPDAPKGSVRFVAYDRRGGVVADTRRPLR